MRLLHFADAHIDMANYGRHDPETGLPLRVLDFLKSLDTIVDAAINEKVDLVIFAGDAYKDRSPAPTFQREWGRRIIRLSQAKIPTLLLVGNHDLSPAAGRAHAIHEFDTLQVPYVKVLAKPEFFGPKDLWGLPIQVIALPWIYRSSIIAQLNLSNAKPSEIREKLETRIVENIEGSDNVSGWLEEADASLPIILTAHASVEGAKYGSERMVMIGNDLTLPGSLVRNQKFSYVALGHIHKPQDLNEHYQPPVIYPGSIERVDFGEVDEDRFFVIATIEKGKDTEVDWRKIEGTRRFIQRWVTLKSSENITETIKAALPNVRELEGAIVKLTVEYPREFDTLIDGPSLRKYAEHTFEFHVVKRPQIEARSRLPEGQAISSLSPLDLLDLYWRASNNDTADVKALQELARQILSEDNESPKPSL
jgi:exonuclease SbcD